MGRDGEVKQRQHFYHHGDTLCHPKSGYVTINLHGTPTCRRNNNAIFSDRAIFTFPTGGVSQPRYSGRCVETKLTGSFQTAGHANVSNEIED